MNHFAKIAEKLSAHELDGMLLTCEANRFYASGFHSTGTDGVALVTREGNFYFTDSRYIEAAHNKVQDAEIAMTDAAHPYVDLINAAMEKAHVQKLGFEDAYMTVADYRHYSEKLHCQLVPATELLISLRQSKDEEEIQRMIAAQRIAEAALDQIVKEIKPGVTEKEIAARLQYLMLAGGAENMSFDPIVASGPNGSMPHAVPTDRKIQDGDFVTMDFGCIYQGYCSDMTRTVAVGHVTEEMEKVYRRRAAGPAGGHRRRQGRRHRPRRGRRRPEGHRGRRLRPLFRPQLRPQRGRGNPRVPQRHPCQQQAPAPGRGRVRRARHLSARPLRRPHRGRGCAAGGRLPGYHPGQEGPADSVK